MNERSFIKSYVKNLAARQEIIKGQLKSVAMELEYNDIIIKNIEELLNREENRDENTTN